MWQLSQSAPPRDRARDRRRFFSESYERKVSRELAQAVRTVTGVDQLLDLVAINLQRRCTQRTSYLLRDARAGDYACSNRMV